MVKTCSFLTKAFLINVSKLSMQFPQDRSNVFSLPCASGNPCSSDLD